MTKANVVEIEKDQLTMDKTAKYLVSRGCEEVSYWTVQALVRDGQLAAKRIGRANP